MYIYICVCVCTHTTTHPTTPPQNSMEFPKAPPNPPRFTTGVGKKSSCSAMMLKLNRSSSAQVFSHETRRRLYKWRSSWDKRRSPNTSTHWRPPGKTGPGSRCLFVAPHRWRQVSAEAAALLQQAHQASGWPWRWFGAGVNPSQDMGENHHEKIPYQPLFKNVWKNLNRFFIGVTRIVSWVWLKTWALLHHVAATKLPCSVLSHPFVNGLKKVNPSTN